MTNSRHWLSGTLIEMLVNHVSVSLSVLSSVSENTGDGRGELYSEISSTESTKTTFIIIGVLVSLVILVIIIFVFVYFCCCKKAEKNPQTKSRYYRTPQQSQKPKRKTKDKPSRTMYCVESQLNNVGLIGWDSKQQQETDGMQSQHRDSTVQTRMLHQHSTNNNSKADKILPKSLKTLRCLSSPMVNPMSSRTKRTGLSDMRKRSIVQQCSGTKGQKQGSNVKGRALSRQHSKGKGMRSKSNSVVKGQITKQGSGLNGLIVKQNSRVNVVKKRSVLGKKTSTSNLKVVSTSKMLNGGRPRTRNVQSKQRKRRHRKKKKPTRSRNPRIHPSNKVEPSTKAIKRKHKGDPDYSRKAPKKVSAKKVTPSQMIGPVSKLAMPRVESRKNQAKPSTGKIRQTSTQISVSKRKERKKTQDSRLFGRGCSRTGLKAKLTK